MPKPAFKAKPIEAEHWASGILLQAHAIAPCPGCGFMKLTFSHRALDYAHALAKAAPLPGHGQQASARALDDFLDGLDDRCHGCR